MSDDTFIQKMEQDEKGAFINWRLNQNESIQIRLCKKCHQAPLFDDQRGKDDGKEVTTMIIYCPKCQNAVTSTPQESPVTAIHEVVTVWNEIQTAGD